MFGISSQCLTVFEAEMSRKESSGPRFSVAPPAPGGGLLPIPKLMVPGAHGAVSHGDPCLLLLLLASYSAVNTTLCDTRHQAYEILLLLLQNKA